MTGQGTEASPAKEEPVHPLILASPSHRVGFWEAFRFWLKLGFINFGGPAGQIALMHAELVDRRRWISNERFLHALNFCMFLPGPEAQQLAIYVGWLLHRTLGGLVAGVFFVLPAFFFMWGLSWIYAAHGNVAWIAAIFHGLRAAVMAIVAAAVIRIGSRALGHPILVGIAAAAFVAIFFLKIPFPIIIICAAVVGLLGSRFWPRAFVAKAHQPATSAEEAHAISDDAPPAEHTRPNWRRAATALTIGLAAWWLPLAAVAIWRGPSDTLTREALFFSKAAMVTFGGAYAVLSYIAQAAVESYHWLQPGQMLDGLGLAESTPGPLIMVTEFVGFVGAYQHPGDLNPALAGAIGAAVTTWATFAPCFLWIFLGAPFIEQLRGNKALGAALAAITAAVVGVILNLAVWFGIHTLFGTVTEQSILGMILPIPKFATFDLLAMIIAAVAFIGMRRYHWPMVTVILGSAAAGWIGSVFMRLI